MQHLVPLAPMTEDFGIIEYQLQLQLNTPKLKVSECYILRNAHSEAQFQNYIKSLNPQNTIDVYAPITTIGQSISDITSKGLIVDNNSGFQFRVGSFEIDRSMEVIEVIRFTVALGKTFNYQSESSQLENASFSGGQAKNSNLHTGYQSLCISENHDYVIFNSSQIKATHFIKFHGGPDLLEQAEDSDLCDSCGKEVATIWCENDNAKFCVNCDKENHQSRIASKHHRMPLSEARAKLEFCPHHPEQRVEYYCTECQTPVCIKCKMIGTHSKGDAASHQLISIKEAYDEAIDAAQRDDPIFKRRRKAITDKLEAAKQKLNAIISNEKDVESEIMRLANAAIEHARTLAVDKALIVRNTQTELERKLSELETLTKFINVQRNSAGPLTFLRAFDRHSAIVASIQDIDDLPAPLTVEADLTVRGSLDVSPGQLQPQNQSQNQSQYSASNEVPMRQNSPQINSDRNQSSEGEMADQETESSSDEEPPAKKANIPLPPAEKPPPPAKKPMRPKLEPISLVEAATKKEQKNKARGLELTFQPFENSQVITQSSLACALYLALPFRATPQTQLLFSTERNGRSISRMHQMIDNIGITCVLIKKGDYIFGGFASQKWNTDGVEYAQNGSCFLFSLSQDAYIPYRPRIKGACQLYATKDTLTFGKYDLILADNFEACSAIIENSYSVGFEPGSTEAQTFLAGEPNFRPDIVEVWGFFTIHPQ